MQLSRLSWDRPSARQPTAGLVRLIKPLVRRQKSEGHRARYYGRSKEFEMPSEQILLVETFFTWSTTNSLEDEWTRRNKAVAAGIQYCGFQEGGPLQGRRKRSALPDDDDVDPSPPARKIKIGTMPTTSWKEGHIASRKPISNAELTFACFQCPKAYSDCNGVRRHFRTSHLTDLKCNFCDLSVLHEMHLRRHASEAHGLRT
jgi:hypothetical protein